MPRFRNCPLALVPMATALVIAACIHTNYSSLRLSVLLRMMATARPFSQFNKETGSGEEERFHPEGAHTNVVENQLAVHPTVLLWRSMKTDIAPSQLNNESQLGVDCAGASLTACIALCHGGFIHVCTKECVKRCSVSLDSPSSNNSGVVDIEGCVKWNTTGFHDGTYLKTYRPPSSGRWTWQQCAQKCALLDGCEFWTLQIGKERNCFMKSKQGAYHNILGHVEGHPCITCGACKTCEKWSTEGFHEGRYLQTHNPPPNSIWTWQQCAQKCALLHGCVFWTLQTTGRRQCFLKSDRGAYHDTGGHVEGPGCATRVEDLRCNRTKCNGTLRNIISLREHTLQVSYWSRQRGSADAYSDALNEGLDRGAGIDDRSYMFKAMGDVAAAFCARLAVGKPCDFLGRHPTPPSCDKKWSTYINFDRSWDHVLEGPSKQELDTECAADPKRTCISSNCSAVSVAAVLAALHRGEPFTWSITENSFHCRKQLNAIMQNDPIAQRVRDALSISSPFCSVVKPGRSKHTSRIGSVARRTMRIGDGKYAALHIRRGDATKVCDTTLPTVKKYATERIVPQMREMDVAIIVFFTDEADTEYLQGVQVIFADLGVKAWHGDGILTQVEPKADNYVIYWAGKGITASAALHYQMRRGIDCPYGPPSQKEQSR